MLPSQGVKGVERTPPAGGAVKDLGELSHGVVLWSGIEVFEDR